MSYAWGGNLIPSKDERFVTSARPGRGTQDLLQSDYIRTGINQYYDSWCLSNAIARGPLLAPNDSFITFGRIPKARLSVRLERGRGGILIRFTSHDDSQWDDNRRTPGNHFKFAIIIICELKLLALSKLSNSKNIY